MLEQILTALKENQLLQGGGLLMVFGGVVAYLRNLPGRIFTFAKSLFLVELTISQNDDAFKWVDSWTAKNKVIQQWARSFIVEVESDEDGTSIEHLRPGLGCHWLWWRGRPVWVQRDRRDLQSGTAKIGTAFFETYTVTILSFYPSSAKLLLADLKASEQGDKGETTAVFLPNYDDWSKAADIPIRPIESVVLEDGFIEFLLQDVDKFLSRAKWYAELGLPYRRGFLFYGPPGNGKSSIAHVIAAAKKLNLCVLSINKNLTGSKLTGLVNSLPKRALLLIEDIDCCSTNGRDSDDILSFSELLNAIDGILSGEGRILFMTTNHKDKLDPALIRPGRCDVQFEIKNASESQARRLFFRFFPGSSLADGFAKRAVGNCMASLQAHLILYQDDEQKAAEYVAPEGKEASQESAGDQPAIGVRTSEVGGSNGSTDARDSDNSRPRSEFAGGSSGLGQDPHGRGDGLLLPAGEQGRQDRSDTASGGLGIASRLLTGNDAGEDRAVHDAAHGRTELLHRAEDDLRLDRARADRNRPSPIHERADLS
jgi:chaperone BCS1